MDRTTLFPTFAVVTLAVLSVIAFLGNARSDEEKLQPGDIHPLQERPAHASRDTQLRALRSEVRALRVEMREVLSLLKQTKSTTPPTREEGDVVEVSDQTKIFGLEFVPAESVSLAIEQMIPQARVSVLDDDNRLVVGAERQYMQQVVDMVKTLDRPRQQVLINSYLYEIPVAELARLGLENEDDSTGTIRARLGKSLRLETINEIAQTDGVRLLARPNIRAYDHTTATFHSVAEIPVQMLTQTAAGANIGTTEFREVGITLEVSPRITASGTIIMEVHPEYSMLNGFVEEQPIIDRRSATTTVRVKDGEPIVISGLRSQQRPAVAGSTGEPAKRETELLIIMSAEIIRDGQ